MFKLRIILVKETVIILNFIYKDFKRNTNLNNYCFLIKEKFFSIDKFRLLNNKGVN